MNNLLEDSTKIDGCVRVEDGRTIHIQATHITHWEDVDHRHDLLHPMDFRTNTVSSQVVLNFLGFGVPFGSLDDKLTGRTLEDDSERHKSPYEIVKQLKATVPFMYEVHQQ